MNSKPLTIEEASKPVPYIGHITAHPFAIIIENYLKSIDIDPSQVKREVNEEVIWNFYVKGVSIAYRLYKDQNKELFLHVECAFGFVPEGCEDMIATTLLQEHYHHHYPFWHALNEDRLAVIMFRSYCDGITESHFLLRLDTIIKMGLHCKDVFVKAGMGVKALPTGWFEKENAA